MFSATDVEIKKYNEIHVFAAAVSFGRQFVLVVLQPRPHARVINDLVVAKHTVDVGLLDVGQHRQVELAQLLLDVIQVVVVVVVIAELVWRLLDHLTITR